MDLLESAVKHRAAGYTAQRARKKEVGGGEGLLRGFLGEMQTQRRLSLTLCLFSNDTHSASLKGPADNKTLTHESSRDRNLTQH